MEEIGKGEDQIVYVYVTIITAVILVSGGNEMKIDKRR